MKTLNEWQYEIDAQGQPNYFFDTLTEASQKLQQELRQLDSPGFSDMADMAMSINRVLVELQHTGEVSERTEWQCKYLAWKCEQFHESNWIHGAWGTSLKTEIKIAIESFLKLTENLRKVPPTEIDEASRGLIRQGATAIREMATRLDEMDFWSQKGRTHKSVPNLGGA